MAEFTVTPWEVTGDIDYDELQRKFGTTPIDDDLLKRLGGYREKPKSFIPDPPFCLYVESARQGSHVH